MNTQPISMESLTSTEAWRSLGSNVKRLLTMALQSRNLLAAIRETHPTLGEDMVHQVAANLLVEPNVRRVIDLYAVGITAAKPTAVVESVAVLDAGEFV